MNILFSFKNLPSQEMLYVSVHKLDLFVLNKRRRGRKDELSRLKTNKELYLQSKTYISKPSRNRNNS